MRLDSLEIFVSYSTSEFRYDASACKCSDDVKTVTRYYNCLSSDELAANSVL